MENVISAWIETVAVPKKKDGKKVPRTAIYRVTNALLDFSISLIQDHGVEGFESWEIIALTNFFENKKIRDLNPEVFFVGVSDFNPALGEKIRLSPRETKLRLLLKILYERTEDNLDDLDDSAKQD